MPRSNKGGAYLTRSSKRKERTDDLTRNSKKNKRTYFTRSSVTEKRICNGGEPTELLTSGDLHWNSNQGVWSELREEVASNLSKSVVSLALSDGQTVLFAGSGIAVQRLGHVTRFVTSASLAKALNDQRKNHDDLKVEVRHEDSVFIGFLETYDLDLNIAAVNVMDLPDLQAVCFSNPVQYLPNSTVVAVGRDFYGKLTATAGILNDESGPDERFMLSTCKISKVCDGGPLFDFDGNFFGMNLFLGTERTSFLPMIRVLGWFAGCTPLERIKFPAPLNYSKAAVRVGERLTGEIPNSDQEVHRDVLNKDQFGDLESLGYPEPPKSMLNDGMILVNTFEEPFGDVCGKGVWSELSETASIFIQSNIVALASFSGEKRVFACTGLFIEWNGCTTILTSASLLRKSGFVNKIVENLRIKVLLPNKQRAEGALQHYNLHYNVALVSVKDFCAPQPAKIQRLRHSGSWKSLAVGCCFSSGRLMAAKGGRYFRPVQHDCKFLGFSTCIITKAGIGGPLLDFDGTFVGMNFYDKEIGGTPFLSWREILPILEYFKTKGTVAEVGDYGNPSRVLEWTKDGDCSVSANRWHVPKAYWCHPDDLDKHEYGIPGIVHYVELREEKEHGTRERMHASGTDTYTPAWYSGND